MQKRTVKYILFITIFIIIIHFLTLLFVRKGNGYGSDVLNFYQQEKNSIDIIYMGSSHTYASFDPYLIENKTGLNGYVFATQQQPIWITYYYLEEALKYQQPKYIVLDVHMLTMDNNYSEEQVNRDAIDKMKMSITKFNAINTSVENKKERISYYFNIIKYHSRYKELNRNDFKTIFNNYTVNNKGYIGLPENNFKFPYEKYNCSSELEISNKNKLYLNKIINICSKNNIKLILVKTPAMYSKKEKEKLNYIEKISKSSNIEFYNYIKNIDELDLNYNFDFYDNGHLNKNGSRKISINISNKLNNIK